MNTADLIGTVIGVVFIVPTIIFIRRNEFDELAWAMFLITLPLYYMLFGVLAMDSSVVFKELLFGLPYIATGLLVWRMKTATTAVILGLAWLSHGFYDYYHDFLFVNAGVFSWYPAFCAVVDIAVGCYLLLYYRQKIAIHPIN